MVFSSLVFLFVFLPITLIAYYIFPNTSIRNTILLIASLLFYAWGEPVYIVLMVLTTLLDYFFGIALDKLGNRPNAKRAALITALIINLGILGFFKYYGFIIRNINNIFNLSIKDPNLPLPVGISFYTFQAISYLIDVYLGNAPVQKNLIAFSTYITMFPQLVAGPIVQYGDIAKQLRNRKESLDKFVDGIQWFIIGLAKKVLLANNIGALWDIIKNSPVEQISVLSSWIGIVAFTFQIYFDFSGYSDMAIGLGKVFGFDFMKNFDYPYTSKSITEFWRRWHISLGSWFREYVYIPLGGNRRGKLKWYRNILIVWFLTGFWHGADWNFILWGLYFALFLILEKGFLKQWLEEKPAFIGQLYTIVVVIVGWVLFEFQDIGQGALFIKTMFGLGKNKLIDNASIYYLQSYGLIFIILALASTPILKKWARRLEEKLYTAKAIIFPVLYFVLLFLSTAYLVNESYNPFLYFRF